MDLEKIIGFMLHLGDVLFDQKDILEALKQYNIGKYIIAKETTPFTHFHVVVEMTIPDYNAFIAQYVSKSSKSNGQKGGLWQLRGRCKGGLPKQYGKITGIRTPDKLISYTVKQGIYITDVDAAWLKPYVDASFTKDVGPTDREFKDKVLKALDQQYIEMLTGSEFKFTDKFLLKTIIKYHLKNKIAIRTKSYLDGLLRHIRQYSSVKKVRVEDPEYYYLMLYGTI